VLKEHEAGGQDGRLGSQARDLRGDVLQLERQIRRDGHLRGQAAEGAGRLECQADQLTPPRASALLAFAGCLLWPMCWSASSPVRPRAASCTNFWPGTGRRPASSAHGRQHEPAPPFIIIFIDGGSRDAARRTRALAAGARRATSVATSLPCSTAKSPRSWPDRCRSARSTGSARYSPSTPTHSPTCCPGTGSARIWRLPPDSSGQSCPAAQA
jgi:hypothetical protein